MVNNVVSILAAVAGTIVADKGQSVHRYDYVEVSHSRSVGRRPLWFWGTLGCAGMLSVSAGQFFVHKRARSLNES